MEVFLDSMFLLCSSLPMPAALAPAEPSLRPDPPQDRPAPGAAAPSRFGRLLGLVRKLIDYGKERAGIVLQPAAAADICLCVNFGSRNVALMFARITRGLMLLAALEARLIGLVGRAERQRQAADAAAAAGREQSAGKPRAAQTAGARAARRLADPESLLVRMPTAEEIAAFVRRRPIGAVIADICSDLGIVTPNKLWQELEDAVAANGGGYSRLTRDLFDRCSLTKLFPPDLSIIPPGWRSVGQSFAGSTGPPSAGVVGA